MFDDFCPKWIVEPAKNAVYAQDFQVQPQIMQILKSRGIDKFYLHQARAIKLVEQKKSIVLMAPTSAGKTECYMIPVVQTALRSKTALMIFPTKALSRDQFARIREFAILGVRSEVYDGDTPQSKRKKIRSDLPHVIITNVDMLHFMLSNSQLWSEFFSKLELVVIDEVHAYSGILGAHVANLMWRLKRICKNYKQQNNKLHAQKKLFDLQDEIQITEQLQFILSSATVGNALDFSQNICNEKLELVIGDSAPRTKINHAIINLDEQSMITTCLKLAQEARMKTIIFANSHNVAERLALIGKKNLMDIEVYRSGIDTQQRRSIEAGFRSSRIKMLATTSALELGIDVGDAQLAIMAGFAGTITKMKQRTGRIGRKGQQAYSVLVARQTPLDQYYANNEHEYLYGQPEDCFANMYNENIRKMHLLSACKDKVLSQNEVLDKDIEILQQLCKQGFLREFAKNYMSTAQGTIAIRKMSLRNAGKRVRIFDEDRKKIIGERELSMAIAELYPGAIYLMGAKKYQCNNLDITRGQAVVSEINQDDTIFTQALREKNAEITKVIEESKWNNVELGWGDVHIVDEVYGYIVKDVFSGATISKTEIDEPIVHEYDTCGFWADWDVYADQSAQYASGLHAIEHVSIAMMPAISGADSTEIGGISYPDGRIIYYEGVEGGVGLSQILVKKYEKCINMAHERLKKCECENGCPKCVYSPQCSNNNFYIDKKKAIEIIEKAIHKNY